MTILKACHRGAALALIACASLAASSAAAPPPKQSSLSISDVSVTEGDAGTVDAVFTVRLSAAWNKPVTVDFATADGTASTIADYESASGTLVFARGELSKELSVRVHGDTLDEADEAFFVRLSSASQAVIGDGTGRATIVDDDDPPPPPPTHTLSVRSDGSGSGSITSDPAGIDCGADCTQDYDEGTTVTLTATPAPGSAFAGWSGACAGIEPCTVTMSAARDVTATFDATAPGDRTLTVARDGDGQGAVTSGPPGIDCGGDCSESYTDGTPVTLTATPAQGSTFAGWSGACEGTGECTVQMDADRHVVATFRVAPPPPAFLTVSLQRASGDTTSRVESTPPGIDCGQTCTATFLAGTVVQLRAVPGAPAGLVTPCFKGWSGDVTGTAPEATVTMSANRAVTARFGQLLFGLCT